MPAENKPAEVYVQNIACVNNAGFVMFFKVRHAANGTEGDTPQSATYPINQSRTIDLKDAGLPVGAAIHPVVQAIAGIEKQGPKVKYAPNGQTATYMVTGTTLIYDINRI